MTLLGGCSAESPGPPPGPPPPPAEGIPASWDGVWTVTLVVLDCDSGGVVQESSGEQIFCEGEPFRFEFDDPLLSNIECDGTVDDDTFELICEQTFTVLPDCDVALHVMLAGTKVGETFSGSGTLTTTNTENVPGACGDFLPLCFGLTIEGTRDRDSGADCP